MLPFLPAGSGRGEPPNEKGEAMKQRMVSIEQAGPALERWVQLAGGGETVVITSGGRPVARLVPPLPEIFTDAASMRGHDPALVSLLGWEDAEEMLRFLGES